MNERGSLLIAALWAMSVFSIMAASFTLNASRHVLMMKREKQKLEDKADFISGLNRAVAKIRNDEYPHEDSKDDPWYGGMGPEKGWDERIWLEVRDEESKLNLNSATERQLNVFFKNYEEEVTGLKGSRKDYVTGIVKLREKKRIESLEELLLMDDFEREDYAGLTGYLTVYPDSGAVNINTASSIVLRSIVEAIPGDEGSKQILAGKLAETCGAESCFFLNRDLTPAIFSRRLRLPGTPFMETLVQELLSKITTDSENFGIQIRSRSGRLAQGVFCLRVGQAGPETYGWHED